MIEATYRVVTPMFIGGATPGFDDCQVRTTSIKGALMFWYRALMLSKYSSFDKVRKAEAALFGSPRTGQAKFRLSVIEQQKTLKKPFHTWPEIYLTKEGRPLDSRGYGVAYLAFGLVRYVSKRSSPSGQPRYDTTRCAIENGRFAVRIDPRARAGFSDTDAEELTASLKIMGLLGGLGARSRHGVGSVSLESLKLDDSDEWEAPQDVIGLSNAIKGVLCRVGRLGDSEPEYTAFSRHSRIVIARGGSPESRANPEGSWNDVGCEMIRYRSYGRAGPYAHGRWMRLLPWNEEIRTPGFTSDHDDMKAIVRKEDPGRHPRRLVFGMPHNYHFDGVKGIVSVDGLKESVDGREEFYQRRASPLLIHVHPLGNEYVTVLSLLRARFLPEDAKIRVRWLSDTKSRSEAESEVLYSATPRPAQVDWCLISKFLDKVRASSGMEVNLACQQ